MLQTEMDIKKVTVDCNMTHIYIYIYIYIYPHLSTALQLLHVISEISIVSINWPEQKHY